MTKSKYILDAAHSSVDFQVKHMMISKVKGTFEKFSADITMDVEDLTTADISFTIEADSVNTKQEQRDGHIKGEDFFNVEKFPTIDFKATEITKKSGDKYNMAGELSLAGVTQPVTFDVTFEGQSKNPMDGTTVAGFSANTTISRKDFGIVYNSPLETGGVLIGDDIKISVEIEVTTAE